MKSPVCLPGRVHRGLDGDREAGGDRRRTRTRAEAQRRMAGGGFLASRGMPRSRGRGRKLPDAVAASRSRRSRLSARSGHERSRGTCSRTARGDALATGSAPPPGNTPARPRAPPPTQPSAGRYRSDLAPFLASSARPLSGRSRRTPRWCCTTLGEPDPLLTAWSSPPLLWARSTAGPRCGAALAILLSIDVLPPPPGAGCWRTSRVRDRARQGRNGKAGSSGVEEPGPKGDAKLSSPFTETSDATQVVVNG